MTKDYQELPDDLLLEQCRLDNLRAYDQLFERYFSKLYNFSLNYVNNSAIAEELVMDLMFTIWKKRRDLEINGELSSYLFTALKNVMYNHLRKKELLTTELTTVLDQASAESHAADHHLHYKELEEIYHLKLNQLSPQRRKIFKLSREEQMTYPQIAENMNLSVNTIKTQMLVSLKYLRESLREHIDITTLLILVYFF